MSHQQRPQLTVQTASGNALPDISVYDETLDDTQESGRPSSEDFERGRQLLRPNNPFVTPTPSMHTRRSRSPQSPQSTLSPSSKSRARNSMISDWSRSHSRLRRALSHTDSKKTADEEGKDVALMNTLADKQNMNLLKADIKSALEGSGSWLKKSAPNTPNPNRKPVAKISQDIRRDGIELQELSVSKTDSRKSDDFTTNTNILPTSVSSDLDQPKNVEGVYRKLTTRLKSIGNAEHHIFGYDEPSNSGEREGLQTPHIKKLKKAEPVIELQRPRYQLLILYGKSLGIFDRFNPFRRRIAEVLRNPWLTRFLRVLLVLQTALLSYRQWNPRKLHGYAEYGDNWADWLLVVVNVIFTFEVLAKIVAWGFWDDSQMFDELGIPYATLYEKLGVERLKHYFISNYKNSIDTKFKHSVTFAPFSQNKKGPMQRAYLRKTWNRLDFVSTVCFWIDFFLSLKRKNTADGVPLFRALSCLRILRLTSSTNKISLILETIKNGLPQLMDVMLFMLYFWILFAIIGTESFKSSFRRVCVWTNPDDPTDTYISSQTCGGSFEYNASGELIRKPYFIGDDPGPRSKGYLCPVNSKCMTLTNPYNNMYGFDNILNSMQLTFVVMSGNTFSNIMYSAMDSESMAACIYFIFGIFFLLLWMTNLLIAVISSSFRATFEQTDSYEEKEALDDFDLTWEFPRGNVVAKYYRKAMLLFDLLCLVPIISLCRRDLEHWSPQKEASELKLQRIVSLILLVEIIIRFVAYLPTYKAFFKDRRNRIDLSLAVITSIILIPVVHDKLGRGYEWMKAFFIIRFYRDVLLFGFVRKLWAKVWRSISIIANLSFFFFTLLYLTAIIFARYFENFASSDDISSLQFPFHTLPNAFIGLFAITSTENWSEFMYSMQAIAPSKFAAFCTAILFILWFLLSNTIILNLFIAIIGESLSVSEKQKRKEQVKKFVLVDFPKRLRDIAEKTVLTDLRSRWFGGNSQNERDREIHNLLLNGAAIEVFLKDELEEVARLDNSSTSGEVSPVLELSTSKSKRFFQIHYRRFLMHPLVTKIQEVLFLSWKGRKNPFYENRRKDLEGEDNYLALAEKYQNETEKIEEERRQYLRENPSFNMALYILSPKQPLRKLCQKIVKSSHGNRYGGTEPNKIANTIFTVCVSLATVAVIVVACYYTPLYSKTQSEQDIWNWSLVAQFSFISFFLLEFAIKIIADGLIFTPNAYFRNVWNVIDFIVLLSMWVNLIAILKSDKNLSIVVRGLKALRALRLLTVSDTSKDIFHKVMIAGVWKIFGAAILSFTLLFPFAVWGLNLFSGRLGVCNDGDMSSVNCINEYVTDAFDWEILAPRAYTHPQLEFNRFSSALLTLFEVLSLEGWTDLLQNLTSSTGIGSPAENYASPENGVFMVLFIYVGLIFVLTLFITVIITNYGILSGRAFLTLEQTSWNEVKKLLKQTRPRQTPTKKNMGPFKTFCYDLTIDTSKWVNTFLFTILWIHILAILLEKYPSVDALDNFRYTVFIISSSVFLTFTILRMIAIGPRRFFKVRWNIYVFLVFFGAFLTSFASFFVSRNTVFANINKLFLVGIFTIIIYRSNRLSHLLKIASASIPSLLSLIFTWAILFLVYAIALNQIFGLTRLGPNTSDNQNLRTVTKALILLFKNSFGEGWNYTMRDFAVEYPECIGADEFSLTDCGNMQYAYILFISWNIVSMYIFVNMFISLIFESFSYVYTTNGGSAVLNRQEIRKFKSVWQQFDPHGTGFIPVDKLPMILASLDGYFSFRVYDGKWSISEITKKSIQKLSQDPYDVDIDIVGINRQLNHLDIFKVNERRKMYERLIEEAKFNMELYDEPGISFDKLILQIPLYSRFDESNCLTLTEFLDRLVISRKITERLRSRRCLETLRMIMPRWRYLASKQPQNIIAFYGEPNHEHFIRKNPFDTPNLGGSGDVLPPNQVLSEAQDYWSPARYTHENNSDVVLSELSDIASNLSKSQWRYELSEVNTDVESFLGTFGAGSRTSRSPLRDNRSDSDEEEEMKSSEGEFVSSDEADSSSFILRKGRKIV